MRKQLFKSMLFLALVSVVAVSLPGCIYTGISDTSHIDESHYSTPENTLLTSEPTVHVDYNAESDYLIDSEAVLDAILESKDGGFPDKTSDFGFIFNRYYISRYADTDKKKNAVLGLYISMLTSQTSYVFDEDAGITTDEFSDMIAIIKADTPEFIHIQDEYTRYSDADTDMVTKVGFKYDYEPMEYHEKLESTLSIIDGWAENTEDTSMYEKELRAYSEIINRCEYTREGDDIASAYGAIVRGKALCEGYSDAFTLSMYCMNIDCMQIFGTGTNSSNLAESHAWNYVELDGDWYATDITWDDSASGTAGMLYAYTNITSDEIAKNHTVDESLLSYDLPTCTAHALNYHNVNGNIVEESENADDRLYETLDSLSKDATTDTEIGFIFKFEDADDYDDLVDNIDSWLKKWNRGRHDTYISKYKYSCYEKFGVIRFSINIDEV